MGHQVHGEQPTTAPALLLRSTGNLVALMLADADNFGEEPLASRQ